MLRWLVSVSCWVGVHVVRFDVVSPLFSCWTSEQEEFWGLFLEEKQNLSVVDKVDPVK